MFKLNGTEYSLEEVTSAAESSNLSVDEYVNEFGLETVEVTDEIQTTPTEGKTNGAVAKGATATPVTGQAPENTCLLYTSPSPRDRQKSRMPSSA